MKISFKIILELLIISLLIYLVGCSKYVIFNKSSSSSNTKINLTISAASSLKDSLEEIKTAYLKEGSKVNITYNFGSSGALSEQIEQGADVDIFLSAAAKQMDALSKKDLILSDTKKNILQNEIVLVIPKDSSEINTFLDLTSDKINKIALGEPKSVPAGQYAEEVFAKLGILSKVKSKAVYGKDVKEVLTWVESGNADAGIVYVSDAKTSAKVKIIAVASSDSHSQIFYPAAIIKSSKNVDAAKNFMFFLSSDKAKAIFKKYGFRVNM